MKNKAPLALMELLIMLLVFALAAALCLQAFSTARQTSLENELRDSALLHAQNAAELVKYHHGDFSAAKEHFGGSAEDRRWTVSFDKNWSITSAEGLYRLEAVREDSDIPLLGMATISVTDSAGNVLCSLPLAWQEVTAE